MTNIPDCFTNKFLEKVLQSGLHRNDIRVIDAKVKVGTSAGDNYCSEIYRAYILYQENENELNKKISLIIKALPYREYRSPALNELEVFDKEVEMYTKTLPHLSRLLGGQKISAKCFYSTVDPFQMIVFEDLSETGYMMADRNKGLCLEHTTLVLKFMARLHAASYVLGKNEPNAMNKYDFGLLKPDSSEGNLVNSIISKGIVELIDTAKKWPGYQEIVQKLINIQNDYLKRLKHKTVEQQTNCMFNVLNHGDSWVNNFMFKYIEGRPISVIFVDYQLVYYSSPGIDLNYFIYTSPTIELREKKYNELINIYYDQLALTLDAMKSKFIPKIDDIHQEMKRCQYYAAIAAFGVLPFVMLDEKASETSDFETLGGDESEKQRKLMYNCTMYQQAIKPILKRFDESKLLDELAALKI